MTPWQHQWLDRLTAKARRQHTRKPREVTMSARMTDWCPLCDEGERVTHERRGTETMQLEYHEGVLVRMIVVDRRLPPLLLTLADEDHP